MWPVLSFLVGALAAVGLAYTGIETVEPLYDWPFVRGILSLVIITLSAAAPTWLVGRIHSHLSRAHLLAYFATLIALFVVIALLNIEVEL